MKTKITKNLIIYLTLVLFILNSNSYAFPALASTFNMQQWQKIRKEKTKKIYKKKEIRTLEDYVIGISTATAQTKKIKAAGLTFDLPYQSELSISGQKTINLAFGYLKYADPKTQEEKGTPAGVTDGFDMKQALQVRIKGKVGRKIDVNVNYDDTRDDRRDISVVYKGHKKGEVIDAKGTVAKKDEIIEEVAFGDINLSLPSTEFTGYNKNLFGVSMKGQYEKLKFMAIASRTKGLTETKVFKGNTEFYKSDAPNPRIKDIDYYKRKYYKLYFNDNDNPFTKKELIENIKIYLYDNTTLVDKTNIKEMVVEKADDPSVIFPVNNKPVEFKLLTAGKDYIIDYTEGYVVFKQTLAKNYVVAINYSRNGSPLRNDSQNFIMIKEDETISTNNSSYHDISKYHEVKSYYYLGNKKIIKGTLGTDFILKILDLNEEEVEKYKNIYDLIEVDFDTGILKFKKDKFFNSDYSDIYDINNPQNHYLIYVEYYYRVKIFTLKPNVILGSEQVILDGKVLKRDIDYMFDYDIGLVTFINEDKINRDSVIEITYEFTPFGAQTQQTLAGLRLEYGLPKNSHLGTTVIYSGASKPSKIPNIRSTPYSISVVDVDTTVNFDPFGVPFLPLSFPFTTTLSGEAAMSSNNPNTMNRAMIDSMEGIKEEDTAPTNEDIWRVASNPDNSFSNFDWISWDNEDVALQKINPNNKSEKENTEVLILNYNLEPGKKYSVAYPISTVGTDYSQKEFLEFWLYKEGDGNNLEFNISYGSINEDSDHRGGFKEDVYHNSRLIWKAGSPKTEDLNGDGILGPNEDTGWDFYNSDGSITKVGASNGELDSQDLDNDGVLDSASISGWTYGTTNNPWIDNEDKSYTQITWNSTNNDNWKRIKTPLNIVKTGANNITTTDDDDWTNIKHLRLTITNPHTFAIQGKLKVSNISLVGNKWEKGVVSPAGAGTLTVTAINNEDDPNYDPLSEKKDNDVSLDAKDKYTDLYKGIFFLDDKEQALSMQYNNLQKDAKAYTRYTFYKNMDFSKYKKLGLFVYGDGNNEEFFVQIGANDSNYFIYKETISSEWKNKWEYKELILEDIIKDGKPDSFEIVGNPSLTNITEIKVGVTNKTTNSISGKILVNEIHLKEVIKKKGYAYKGSATFARKDWMSISGTYKETDRNFETITAGSGETELVRATNRTSGKDVKSGTGNLAISRIKFLPMSGSVNKTETFTPDTFNTSGSINEGGLVTSNGKSANTTIKWGAIPSFGRVLKYIPEISGSYSTNESYSELLKKKDLRNSYNGNFNYTMPKKYFFLPLPLNDITTFLLPVSLGAKYSKSENKTEYEENEYGKENIKTFSENYNANMSFKYGLRNLPIIKYIPLVKEPTIGLSPSYNLTTVTGQKMPFAETIFDEKYPQSLSQAVGLTGNLGFRWFNPSFSYNINVSENYDLITSTATGSVSVTTKDISRNSNANASLSLGIKQILPWAKPFSSLNVSGSYSIQDGDTWQDLNKDFNIRDKLIIRNFDSLKKHQILENDERLEGQGIRKSLSSSDNMSTTARFNPLAFINFKNLPLKPLNSISTTATYSQTDSKNDTTGTKTFGFSRIWPNASVDLRNPEQLLLLNWFSKSYFIPLNWFSNTNFRSSYSYKISKSGNIMQEINTPNARSNQKNISGSYSFKLLQERGLFFVKNLDCSINGSESKSQEDYVKDSSTATATVDPDFIQKSRSYGNSWGAQVSFNFGIWKVTPRYDQSLGQSFDDQDIITKHTTTKTAALKANADFSLPTKIRIPFTRKYLNFTNRLRLNNEFRANFIEDEMDINQNKNEFSYTFSGTYDMRKNFTMTLGAKYIKTHFHSEEKRKDNFYSIEANAQISIVF